MVPITIAGPHGKQIVLQGDEAADMMPASG